MTRHVVLSVEPHGTNKHPYKVNREFPCGHWDPDRPYLTGRSKLSGDHGTPPEAHGGVPVDHDWVISEHPDAGRHQQHAPQHPIGAPATQGVAVNNPWDKCDYKKLPRKKK